jgi:small subunit ribosomal protein S3
VGQKTHPIGFRLGITKGWLSYWFDEKNFSKFLHEDLKLRKYIETKLADALVSRIEVRRVGSKTTVTIFTARPGMVFGARRASLDSLREELKRLTKRDVQILVEVVRVPEIEAKLVAQNIARQIEQRVAHRRAMKRAITQAIRLGASGIKIRASGRLGGAEIARTEQAKEGQVPLHTLRADIDFATDTAKTIYGTCGVKVWIHKGDSQAQPGARQQ